MLFKSPEDLEYHARLVRAGKFAGISDRDLRQHRHVSRRSAEMPSRNVSALGRRALPDHGRAGTSNPAYDVFVRGRFQHCSRAAARIAASATRVSCAALGAACLSATGPLFLYGCVAMLMVALHVFQAMILVALTRQRLEGVRDQSIIRRAQVGLSVGGVLKAARKEHAVDTNATRCGC